MERGNAKIFQIILSLHIFFMIFGFAFFVTPADSFKCEGVNQYCALECELMQLL